MGKDYIHKRLNAGLGNAKEVRSILLLEILLSLFSTFFLDKLKLYFHLHIMKTRTLIEHISLLLLSCNDKLSYQGKGILERMGFHQQLESEQQCQLVSQAKVSQSRGKVRVSS